eukprot:7741551-Lingulodinium_polyedra.AAC.1
MISTGSCSSQSCGVAAALPDLVCSCLPGNARAKWGKAGRNRQQAHFSPAKAPETSFPAEGRQRVNSGP